LRGKKKTGPTRQKGDRVGGGINGWELSVFKLKLGKKKGRNSIEECFRGKPWRNGITTACAINRTGWTGKKRGLSASEGRNAKRRRRVGTANTHEATKWGCASDPGLKLILTGGRNGRAWGGERTTSSRIRGMNGGVVLCAGKKGW